MDKTIIEFAREWLGKAEDDMKWAKASFGDGFYPQTCFVCQQVAEKAVKGLLYGNRKRFKTHDLIELLRMLVEFEPEADELKSELGFLNPMYIKTRYPDAGDIVEFQSREKAEQALENAQKVLDFVERKFGEEENG